MIEAISVCEQSVSIKVTQASKNLWTFHGLFAGSAFSVSAANRRTAVNRWRKAAESRI